MLINEGNHENYIFLLPALTIFDKMISVHMSLDVRQISKLPKSSL